MSTYTKPASVQKDGEICDHFILDTSVLTKTIMTIKRWSETPDIVFLVPLSTLHELDRLKSGVSTLNINARESVRFIERLLKQDENISSGGSNHASVKIQKRNEVIFWKKCDAYLQRRPKQVEFNTVFNPALKESETLNLKKQALEKDEFNGPDAKIGNKTRSLLEAVLYQIHWGAKNQDNIKEPKLWSLITEDEEVKIWAEAYGIKTLSIEAANEDIRKVKELHKTTSDDTSDRADLESKTSFSSAENLKVFKQEVRRRPRRRSTKSNKSDGFSKSSFHQDSPPSFDGFSENFDTEGDNFEGPKFKVKNADAFISRGTGQLWTS